MRSFVTEFGRPYWVVFVVADMPAGQEARVMEPERLDRWGWFPWDQLPSPLMQGTQKLVARGVTPWDGQ